MDPRTEQLVVRMLGFQHRGPAQGMNKIHMADGVVVCLHRIWRESFVPWEGQILLRLPLEVVLDMALCAHERTHFLVRRLPDILSLPLERLGKRRAGDPEIHGLRVVTVLAADVVNDLRAKVCP